MLAIPDAVAAEAPEGAVEGDEVFLSSDLANALLMARASVQERFGGCSTP